MLIYTFFIFDFFLCLILVLLFFLASKKFFWDLHLSSGFECGFSSWFFSRFSFSIHYFMVALIFLFLDLELCMVFPFMSFCLSSIELLFVFFFFVIVLVGGLVLEWHEGKLDWVY